MNEQTNIIIIPLVDTEACYCFLRNLFIGFSDHWKSRYVNKNMSCSLGRKIGIAKMRSLALSPRMEISGLQRTIHAKLKKMIGTYLSQQGQKVERSWGNPWMGWGGARCTIIKVETWFVIQTVISYISIISSCCGHTKPVASGCCAEYS